MATRDETQGSGNRSPFHAGERAVQERVGVRAVMERAGRHAIRDFMPDQHRQLIEQLPFLIVGSLDDAGQPWASIVAGRPGFAHSPDAHSLVINAAPLTGDPLRQNLVVGRQVGLLGIQLETRRRNRMNGPVVAASEGHFAVQVVQSFGNCPQYIWARAPAYRRAPEAPVPPANVHREGATLSTAAVRLVAQADTFFIATAAPPAEHGHGVDISHRGGKPGFVRVENGPHGTVLTAPDFSGNMYFNTLGNVALNPRAGLLFPDFAGGAVLSLTGTAEILWEGPELEAFAGAERLVRFTVQSGWRIDDALPFRWTAAQPAPQLADTGAWGETFSGP